MNISLISAVCLLPVALLAADLPSRVLPAGVGVTIHFTRGCEKDLDLIQAAGFRIVYMDFFWLGTERESGKYDWSNYDILTSNLQKRDLRPLYILDYSNPLYERTMIDWTNSVTGRVQKESVSPQHLESVAAYARWAGAAAGHFRGRGIIWEIWNEPNISMFWWPKPDVQQYTTLALATCRAIRQADPQATIVAPACALFDWEFLDAFLKSGVLNYLDGVSVHPFRESRPETVAADYERLRELINRYAPQYRKGRISILSTSWGYSTIGHHVSLETQGAYAARQQLVNLLCGVPVSIWYDWKNDGSDPLNSEHNFGTVMPDLNPKPAYTAIQTMTHQLDGYCLDRWYPTESVADYVLVLTNKVGMSKLAAWTTTQPHQISLKISVPQSRVIQLVGSNGETKSVQVEGAKLTFDLSPAPQYLNLGGNVIAQPSPVRWRKTASLDTPWQASVCGDAKVAGSAKASVIDLTDSPQPGLRKAIQIDYQFASGWKNALVRVPRESAAIEGKPAFVGMWFFGNASGDVLRCTVKDSTGQTFQHTFGPITWTGWKWITMPLDGSDADHWGGANDGVIHYPIQWESPILIDGIRLKVDQPLQVRSTGFAAGYPQAAE